MSTEIIDRPLSYEEERGKPMPSLNHAAVQTNLALEIAKHRDFRVLSELSLDLGGEKLVPDLSVYRRQPLDFRHDVIRCTEPPLLAVEIFSPMQPSQMVMEKLDAYFKAGVKSCWVVFPPSRSITAYTHDGHEKTHTEGTMTDPATGITVDLAAVFA